MGLSINLLGRPVVSVDDGPVSPPRGRKAWGLLAYLLGARAPVSREHLASLLFSDADDPLGALRWNLTQIRRLLGDPRLLLGQPMKLVLPPGTYVDVHVLISGTWLEAVAVPSLERELLEGMSFSSCPAFEAWLLSERRHLQAAAEGMLREAALARLVAGQQDAALDLAARLVAFNPYDEAHQELLIRSYAAGGDREGASRQLSACIQLFRRELGVEPGAAVFAAAEASGSSFAAPAITGRAAARAQLEAGEAAIDAGALEAGLQCLRRASAEAHSCGDLELKAKALFALGSALVYAAVGRSEEGAAALHEVISITQRTGPAPLAASAHQLLALIEGQRGRYERARGWLAKASELAGDDDAVQAGILMFLGSCFIETGSYQKGMRLLNESVDRAGRVEDLRTVASSLAELGRAHFLRNELGAAREALERSLELARTLAMTTFLPFPESFLGQVELAEGNLETARDHLEHAFALGCQVGDPCWEGLGGTGLGLLSAACGDLRSARTRLEDARKRCIRSTDASVWVLACALDALCSVAVAESLAEAPRWIADLEALAGRTGMRELLVRTYLHRHNNGEHAALETAKLLCREVDNPYLQKVLEGATPPIAVPAERRPE